MAHPLVHLNAALNVLATLLLAVGLWQVKRGRETHHGRTMLAAFVVSTFFLASYLTYHVVAGSVKFTHPGWVRYIYYAILLSHVLLAAVVPFLAVWAIHQGLRSLDWRGQGLSTEQQSAARQKHRQVVQWAWPIWMYVSVTGVAVYLMLYHLWPSEALLG